MENTNTIPSRNMSRLEAGWLLTKASWRAFKLDKELVWLQFFGGTLAIVTFIVLGLIGAFLGAWLFGDNGVVPKDASWAQTVASIFAMWVLLLAILLIKNVFEGAIIHGITHRFNGGDPTVRSSFAGSMRRLRPLFWFSGMMATVGIILQLLEEKLPFIGALAVRLVGAAWEIANFFAVPVIVLNEQQVKPLTATRESVNIIKRVWGEGIAMHIGVGIVAFLVTLVYIAVFGGIIALAVFANMVPVAVGVGVVGLTGFLILSLLFDTFSAIVKAALYQYAVTGKSPALFNEDLLNQAAVQRRAGRRQDIA